MAVNKNFVVKNGLEVATDVILADASTKNVGLGSTSPQFTLDVRGGIGATDIKATGFTTATQGLQVGTSGSIFYVSDTTNNVGVGTSVPNPIYTLDVRSSVSTGQTALYVYGDMRVTGDINLDDITLDDATIQDLTVSDTFIVSGLSTFSSELDINTDVNISGVATIATLNAAAGIITASSVNVSGLTTTKDLLVTGVVTATSFVGSGQIGVGSEGTFIGAGATMVDFKSSGGSNTVSLSSGIATVTVQSGVSLGLAIALGG